MTPCDRNGHTSTKTTSIHRLKVGSLQLFHCATFSDHFHAVAALCLLASCACVCVCVSVIWFRNNGRWSKCGGEMEKTARIPKSPLFVLTVEVEEQRCIVPVTILIQWWTSRIDSVRQRPVRASTETSGTATSGDSHGRCCRLDSKGRRIKCACDPRAFVKTAILLDLPSMCNLP
jgi:hypothetical protein